MYCKTPVTLCQHDFSEKSRYDRVFKQATHKGGESAIHYIKIFQNAQALSVSVGNTYSENQRMHIFSEKSRYDRIFQ